MRTGVVVGCFIPEKKEGAAGSPTPAPAPRRSAVFQNVDKEADGKLTQLLQKSKPLKALDTRVFFGLTDSYDAIAVVGVGEETQLKSKREDRDIGRENIRSAAAVAIQALEKAGISRIFLDTLSQPDAVAEAATLFSFKIKDFKKPPTEPEPDLTFEPLPADDEGVKSSFADGVTIARGQNFARYLAELPCSHMYPERFCQLVQERFANVKNVTVEAHDQKWAETKGMGSFLSVNAGNFREPRFLEATFTNAPPDTKPIVLVGKGVCFDSGGISLKTPAKMDLMRMDMGGGATVVGILDAIANAPKPPVLNLKVLVPLVENMPSAKATRPGDIVRAMDGTHIKVDNTDAEGRLILADALCYANSFDPAHVIDIATLTGAMIMALGAGAAGYFTHSDEIVAKAKQASYRTGDRLWRMPLYEFYGNKMKNELADLCNIAPIGTGGGACAAAGFLQNFVKCESWAHVDIAGVMHGDEEKYLNKIYSGKTTRTLTELVKLLAKKD